MRATQFFEFVATIAGAATVDGVTRATSRAIQPVASADVAALVADVALAAPLNGMIEIAGPVKMPVAKLVKLYFESIGEPKDVLVDDAAGYFGTNIDDRSLTPDLGARISEKRFGDWVAAQPPRAA